jgi:hypothetical protein
MSLSVSPLRIALQSYLAANSDLVEDWDFSGDMPMPADGIVGDISGQLYLTPDPAPVGYSELQPVFAIQLQATSTNRAALKTLLEDAIGEVQVLLDDFDSPSYLRPYTPWVTSEMGRSQRPDQSGFFYHLSVGCSVVGSVKSQVRMI